MPGLWHGSGPGGCVELGAVSGLLRHSPVRGARGWQRRRREGAAGLEYLELSGCPLGPGPCREHPAGKGAWLWAPWGAVRVSGSGRWRCTCCRGLDLSLWGWLGVPVLLAYGVPWRGAPEASAGQRALPGTGCCGAPGLGSCPHPGLGLAGAGGASRRGALEAGAGCALAPCGIWESVDLPRASGERAAQAPPSPLVSASPGPRFCQPSAYQQEAKRLPESEVWTPGLRGASGAPCPPLDAPGSSGH